jgi:hypothetical protein
MKMHENALECIKMHENTKKIPKIIIKILKTCKKSKKKSDSVWKFLGFQIQRSSVNTNLKGGT